MKVFLTESDEEKYADFIDGVQNQSLVKTAKGSETPNALDIIDLSDDVGGMPFDYGMHNDSDPQPD